MATNANGWPYPVGTDAVRDGDHAIKALADLLPGRGYAEAVASDVFAVPTGVQQLLIGFASAGILGTGIRVDGAGILVDVAGLYEITLTLAWQAGASGRRGLGWSPSQTAGETPAANASLVTSVVAGGNQTVITPKWSDTFQLPAGRVCMRAFQDSGANVNIGYRRITARRVWTA